MLQQIKLDVSISHVQCLMKITEIYEPNVRVSVMDRVIVLPLTVKVRCDNPANFLELDRGR